MKERPIIFCAEESVLGILSGAKTQTRRIIKPQPPKGYHQWHEIIDGYVAFSNHVQGEKGNVVEIKCPYGKIGDHLWVRETWSPSLHSHGYDADGGEVVNDCPAYKATLSYACEKPVNDGLIWKSPIFMPYRFSRITLEIVKVRVERLQDITPDDAFAEGISGGDWLGDPVGEYAKLWDRLNAKRGYPWSSNFWVWAIDSRRVVS